jgi:hypothetical protein
VHWRSEKSAAQREEEAEGEEWYMLQKWRGKKSRE